MKILRGAIIALMVLAIVGPLVWVAMNSVKTNTELFGSPWSPPKVLAWDNFSRGWNEIGARSFVNSLIATVATLVFLLPIGAMAAYIFAKFPFPGRGTVYALFLGGMMFPNFLVAIPLVLLYRDLGLLNTMHGLVLAYVAYSLSFTIFVLTGFFQAIPEELREAAEIDGGSPSRTFWTVMFPLVRPGLVVVGIFNAIGLWNEYPLAMVLLSGENSTLPLGIASMAMAQNYRADWTGLFAATLIAMVPVLIVYLKFREQLQEAMVAGAVKG
ncbi:MAG: carbohydrate ABC transporter permease [Methanoregulaceae archaeon]|nr:carbohydrate ABC transporter permease [Methanoregulaceae archaeon]